MEFIDQGDYWEWVEVDEELVITGREGESMDEYLTRYDTWLAKQEKRLSEIEERNKKTQGDPMEHEESEWVQDEHGTWIKKKVSKEPSSNNQQYSNHTNYGSEGYKGYKHTTSNYHNGSYQYKEYKEFRPFEEVDKKKWPRTWKMLFRFYFSPNYWKESKYVSDYDWRKRVEGKTEITQRMPKPYDGG